ncbi:MAG: sigma factor-like helix-turn-helix DNA-binding protein, partial [Thermoleophilia bacterium]
VAQEIALRLDASLDRLRDADRLDAFAFQVARNPIADHWRAREARREEPPSDERREVAHCLAPMLRQLAAPYREAIEPTDLGDRTQAEAAELLGLSVPGLTSRVQRGREQVRELPLACCEVAQDPRGQVIRFERHVACGCAASGHASTCG